MAYKETIQKESTIGALNMKKALLSALLVAGIALSFALGRHHAPTTADGTDGRRVLYYVDPMHPAYKSDKPGIAPDCGMQLKPVYADGKEQPANSSVPTPAVTVHLDVERQQLIGLQLASVERGNSGQERHLLGRVSVEDTRVFHVTTAVQGWVQETHGDSSGAEVKKEQLLATYFSPEFVTAVSSYLTATDRGTTPGNESVRAVQYSIDRLRALGMSETQIAEIGESRQVPKRIDVVSPTDGFIFVRNIARGMRFESQTEFYQIADLSRVWVIAEIFESEAQNFPAGTVARITLRGQRRILRARVSNALPEVDPTTRTIKLRLEADNPGFALRPDMFVDVDLPVKAASGLTVPTEAVLDSGLGQQAFVDRGNGFFEPRIVETGWRSGDRVQIVRGLSEGERIVASAKFLVDSESPLRTQAPNPEPQVWHGSHGLP
jgi:Cu(I)/Ag(I) efflux system membrane fusion protein